MPPEANYRVGFFPLEVETDPARLPVEGEVPPWLGGTLVRNGPSLWEPRDVGRRRRWRMRHWFDGLAMLHAFAFREGAVSYANRFVQSPQYRRVRERGEPGYQEFATNPPFHALRRLASVLTPPKLGHNASVNVHEISGRSVALTETALPVEFDPGTLRTLGVLCFEDALELLGSSAHPHVDAANGDTWSTMTRFGRESSYGVFRVPRGTLRREVVAELPTREPPYIHSFGLTTGHVVLAEYPLVANPLKMLVGKPYARSLSWKPDRPARFRVFDKRGAPVGDFEAEPFFCFHHANAFERDRELFVDLLAFPDASVIDKLYLDVLRGPREVGLDALGELRRYRLPLSEERGSVGYEKLTHRLLEFPRINYEGYNGREYAYVYGIGLDEERPAGWADRLLKVDVRDGASKEWREEGCYPGEPVFVPAPDGAEDEGVILSVVLDAAADVSFLLVLDAYSMNELARAWPPHRIPFGFHGGYFP